MVSLDVMSTEYSLLYIIYETIHLLFNYSIYDITRCHIEVMSPE